ncbi:MAG TPA: hypothetical protein VJS90_00125 [Pseudomonas sp.]|uniref:hypothetical protein n=1 Tax=Pseudomonas sp. TaxID=306 RepID=UPI002B497A9F|nr:hypothetical protein [Pseudomonas sp.]HKS11420.1 hypothetical protein [Pseudomonas sp.]
MAKPTLSEYLTYMKAQPRTYGWGALLVYDRFKTNMLLAQEHVERFAESAWIKPVSARKETETGSWTDVSNLTTGTPVLSFVNSNISGSAARLNIPMMGGKVKTLRQKPGSSQVELVGLSALDPLTAPFLRMNINLTADQNGAISDEGRVTLDLKNGTGYTFEVSGWKDLNEKIGDAIRDEFAKLPDAERVWELNTLKPVEGELKPTSFAVRTHSLARAGVTVASDDPAELEEGAVLVGVAFNGAKGGSLPTADRDMPYLLPEAASATDDPFSANIIINNEDWVKNLLVKMIKAIPEFADSDPVYDKEGGFYVQASFGHLPSTFTEIYQDDSPWVRWGRCNASLIPEKSKTHFRFEDGKVKFEWHCSAHVDLECYVVWSGIGGTAQRYLEHTFVYKKEYSISIGDDGGNKGRVVLVPGNNTVESALLSDDTTETAHLFWNFYVEDCDAAHKETLGKTFELFTSAIEKAGPSIDVLRLNSLLFRSENAVVPQSVHAPGDLSLLGSLAPKLTAFAIEPLNPTIAALGTQTFKLSPAPAGVVKWAVEHLPGGAGEKGSIVNGVYTPPTSAQIAGTSLRVIVSATVGDNVSRSLVTVVPKSVAVFPFLQTVNYATDPAKAPRHVLVGGALDAALEWKMAAGSKGRIRLPTEADSDLAIPAGQNVRIYEAPINTPGEPDTAEMMIQRDRVEVSSNGITEGIDILVPWLNTTATITVERKGAGFELVLWTTDRYGKPLAVAPADTRWFTIVGKNAVDPASGIYPEGEDGDYIVLAAFHDVPIGPLVWNYIVLPIPFDIDYVRLLEHVRINSKARG